MRHRYISTPRRAVYCVSAIHATPVERIARTMSAVRHAIAGNALYTSGIKAATHGLTPNNVTPTAHACVFEVLLSLPNSTLSDDSTLDFAAADAAACVQRRPRSSFLHICGRERRAQGRTSFAFTCLRCGAPFVEGSSRDRNKRAPLGLCVDHLQNASQPVRFCKHIIYDHIPSNEGHASCTQTTWDIFE